MEALGVDGNSHFLVTVGQNVDGVEGPFDLSVKQDRPVGKTEGGWREGGEEQTDGGRGGGGGREGGRGEMECNKQVTEYGFNQ